MFGTSSPPYTATEAPVSSGYAVNAREMNIIVHIVKGHAILLCIISLLVYIYIYLYTHR